MSVSAIQEYREVVMTDIRLVEFLGIFTFCALADWTPCVHVTLLSPGSIATGNAVAPSRATGGRR